jgi:hypothetical protein
VHHVADFNTEIGLVGQGVGVAVGTGVLFGFIYLALEPYARRVAPATLIGWARLLEGKWNDPRVGRDILVGGLAGTACAFSIHLTNGIPTWIPFPGQTTIPVDFAAIAGVSRLASFLETVLSGTLLGSLITFGFFILARFLTRRTWAAALVVFALTLIIRLGAENFWLELPSTLFVSAVAAWVVARHGLLATFAEFFFTVVFATVPLPLLRGAPWVASTWIIFAVVVAVVVAASRIALGSSRRAPTREIAQAA